MPIRALPLPRAYSAMRHLTKHVPGVKYNLNHAVI
jgi:hypothetical protein